MKTPKLPITEKVVNEIVSLPIYPLLRENEAKMIANRINYILKQS